MDSVLNNVNALNRSLEGSIAVGKEFENVSELWKNFYDGFSTMESREDSAAETTEHQEEQEQEKEPKQGETQGGNEELHDQ